MNAEPSDQEFAAVVKLSSWDRYLHFVKRAVDFDQVWMVKLTESEVAIFRDAEGEFLPVWPARRYAEHGLPRSANEEFVCSNIHDWVKLNLMPELETKDFKVAVFPAEDGMWMVPVATMIADIQAELSTRLGALSGFDPDAEEIDLNELLKLAMRASMKAKPKGRLP